MAEHIRQGRLPLWNSLAYCGMSQIAISSPGLFYPPNLLFALAPYSQALALALLFHQMVAGLGCYLLVAGMGWGLIPAAVAGIAFACSGYMFSQYYNFTLMATASWFPVCLWSRQKIDASLSLKSWLAVSMSALSVFLFISAGRPEIWLPGLSVLVCLNIAAFNSRLTTKRHQALWRLLALSIGLCLSMPVILPGLEWALLSPRGHGLPWISVLSYSANWYDFMGLALDRPLGDLEAFASKYAALAVNTAEQFPLASSVFVGPVVLTLALWALLEAGWYPRWLYLAGLVASSFMAAGKNTFLLPWLAEHCGLFVPLRFPAKLLVFPILILAILAARGARTCLSDARAYSKIIWAVLCWSLILAASLACTLSDQCLIDMLSCNPARAELLRQAAKLIGTAGIYAAFIGMMTVLARLLLALKLIRPFLFSSFILVVPAVMFWHSGSGILSHAAWANFYQTNTACRKVIAGLFSAGNSKGNMQYRYLPFMYFPLTPPVSTPGLDWTEKLCQYKRQILMPNQNMDAQVPCADGYESAWTTEHKLVMDAVGNSFISAGQSAWDLSLDAGLPNGNAEAAIYDRGAHQLALLRFCQLTATRYVLTPQVRLDGPKAIQLKFLHPGYFVLMRQFPDMNARLYCLAHAVPRAYFARSWAYLPCRQWFIQKLLCRNYDDYRPIEATYIEPCQGDLSSLPHVLINKGLSEPSVKFVRSGDDDLVLSVQSVKPALLVLADTYYPGWHATLDGGSTQIYRANLLNRAIVVPAGRHIVEYRFSPECLYRGLLLAAAGAGLLVFLLLLAVRHKLQAAAPCSTGV